MMVIDSNIYIYKLRPFLLVHSSRQLHQKWAGGRRRGTIGRFLWKNSLAPPHWHQWTPGGNLWTFHRTPQHRTPQYRTPQPPGWQSLTSIVITGPRVKSPQVTWKHLRKMPDMTKNGFSTWWKRILTLHGIQNTL